MLASSAIGTAHQCVSQRMYFFFDRLRAEEERMAAVEQPRSRPAGDNPDEVFDLVNLDDQVIGQVRRGDAHRDPSLLHRSVQVLVFDADNRLLLQRRSQSKDLFPGYFCASASGHVASGETYESTAQRELREELGITAALTILDKTLIRTTPESEMTAVYLARSAGPFHFHPTETDGGEFYTLPEINAGRAQGRLAMTPALMVALDMLERLRADGTLEAALDAL